MNALQLSGALRAPQLCCLDTSVVVNYGDISSWRGLWRVIMTVQFASMSFQCLLFFANFSYRQWRSFSSHSVSPKSGAIAVDYRLICTCYRASESTIVCICVVKIFYIWHKIAKHPFCFVERIANRLNLLCLFGNLLSLNTIVTSCEELWGLSEDLFWLLTLLLATLMCFATLQRECVRLHSLW